jgi:hypothetical protein
MHCKTVGELKTALADLPDDLLLSRPSHIGGFWHTNGLQVGYLELQKLGSGDDAVLISTKEEFFQSWKGVRGKPFMTLALGE